LAVGGWVLRGGAAGNSLLWVRRPADHPERGVEHSVEAHGFFGDSPGFWIALSRVSRPQIDHAQLRVVEVSGAALATRTMDLRVTATAEDEVTRYEATAVDTGESRTAYLAGEIVVAGDEIELLELARE
jgi:hypothetical protein